MTTLATTLLDSKTMMRRSLVRMRRYPSMTLLLVGMPVVFMLLFVYVFGGTLGAGLGGAAGGRTGYLAYLVPGILLMTVAAVGNGTAVSVAMDISEGIIARFRTMAISRSSILGGHVLGSIVQTFLSLAVVLGVALLLGFRPHAGPLAWLAIIGVFAITAFALIWLTVAMGLAAKTPEGASNAPMPLTILPFLSSGFVPTDSMPAGLRQFAEYQPFTPIIETLRALLMGTPLGNNAILAIGWCVVITLAGYLWARKLFSRDPSQ
jgi:ABC-2 type transport system permease protein